MPRSFSDLKGYVWLNGDYMQCQDANIHFLSYSLHYGASVFEGMRAYSGKVFRLREHIDRLIAGCTSLGIEFPTTTADFSQVCANLLQKNNLQNAYIRPIVWLGPEQMSLNPHKTKVNVGVAAWEWPSYFDSDRDTGIKVCLSRWRKSLEGCAPQNLKAAGMYMIPGLAKQEAERLGYEDTIMLDPDGYIAELSAANFFAVRDGVLYTPRTNHILNGITRQEIISIAREVGISVIEANISVSELKYFSECFATGTAVEVLPINRIGVLNYGVGEITKNLREIYLSSTQGMRAKVLHGMRR
jgi:branched-chain amino acid aminotransferase